CKKCASNEEWVAPRREPPTNEWERATSDLRCEALIPVLAPFVIWRQKVPSHRAHAPMFRIDDKRYQYKGTTPADSQPQKRLKQDRRSTSSVSSTKRKERAWQQGAQKLGSSGRIPLLPHKWKEAAPRYKIAWCSCSWQGINHSALTNS